MRGRRRRRRRRDIVDVSIHGCFMRYSTRDRTRDRTSYSTLFFSSSSRLTCTVRTPSLRERVPRCSILTNLM